MKKLLVLALASILVAGALVPPRSASAASTLVIWADANRVKALHQVATEFTKKYGVEVKLQELGFGDIRDQLGVAAPAGKGPDILVGAHDWLGQLVESGLLAPIDLGAKESSFEPVAIQAFTYNGNLYGVPYATESIGLFYNKNLVPNPPETFDQLRAIAARVSDPAKGVYGILVPQPDPYHTFPFFTALGGYVFGSAGHGRLNPNDVGLNNAGSVEGATLFQNLIKDKLMPAMLDYNTMLSLFKQNKLAMMITGPWAIGDLRTAKVPYGFAQLPTINGHPMRPFVGVQGFMISSFSKNKLLAQVFLRDYVANTEPMLALYKADPRPSAFLPALKQIESDPDMAAVARNAAVGIPMPAIPQMSSVWSAWSNALELIATQKQSPKAALDAAVAQIEKTIQESMKKK